MATFNLRGFASPGILRNIHPKYLRQFLHRFRAYFEGRGVVIENEGIDYHRLAEILITPDEDIPTGLVDALYLIKEMASDEGMESLLAANAEAPEERRADLGRSEELSPADVAMRLWLHDPDLLDRKYSAHYVTRRRSFDYFAPVGVPEEFRVPTREQTEQIERDLAEWYQQKRKGDVVRVFVYPRSDAIWFLIRHGGTFRREGAVKDGASSSVFFRPEEHAIVAYVPDHDEVRINTGGHKGETDLFRRTFGRRLFGSEEHFPESSKKFNLKPLHRDGVASLTCSDIAGIDCITLTEVVYYWGGAHGEVEIRKAKDLFAALTDRGAAILDANIRSARFQVRFSDTKKERSVQVRVPNVASYTRDDDGPLVEEWLIARGFAARRVREKNGTAA